MSLSTQQWLFLQDVAELIVFAEEQGFKLTGGELYRTKEQQEIHFKAGRSKTMASQHLKRLAIDFNIFKDGVYLNGDDAVTIAEPLGRFWVDLDPAHNRWGGFYTSFKDVPHFERME